MKQTNGRHIALAMSVICVVGLVRLIAALLVAQTRNSGTREAPKFQVDPAWPKIRPTSYPRYRIRVKYGLLTSP